jgi:hypothetical protein
MVQPSVTKVTVSGASIGTSIAIMAFGFVIARGSPSESWRYLLALYLTTISLPASAWSNSAPRISIRRHRFGQPPSAPVRAAVPAKADDGVAMGFFLAAWSAILSN